MLTACAQEYNEHLRLRNRAMVSLLLATGIRASELATLSVGHVDLSTDGAYIKVMGKRRKEREIDLDQETRRLLSTYKRKFRHKAEDDEAFFVDRSLTHGLSTSGVEQIIEKLGHLAGIRGVRCSPHTFRHTFATRFIREGGDILRLSRTLGHEHLSITEHYIKTLSPRDIRLSLRRIK